MYLGNTDLSSEIQEADKLFSREAPSLKDINVTHIKQDLWQRIYEALRLFPNGASFKEFVIKYSRLHGESLGNKGGYLLGIFVDDFYLVNFKICTKLTM